ncbi:uncharacterized protein METZ01_LOCUS376017, partial [marine metagenome]
MKKPDYLMESTNTSITHQWFLIE